ncbi:hypothetical protein DFA_06209 [Cavenderia fasciculata]|uniref:THH1/TOM1/TOM3 domain-containing protein n=1 Tax=Cavenderia fasciculata TaxID=261658 RepID=F4PKE7_CACFS|nr:uncharacterized protein DFA_06209 [Cavenderia fasciculata]EGG24071.1 hypothetical protein DFA_06209 [Cavenderia fasciculata]|eukprot:XP_004361922.1 hypothetical protein DFA_06209 [Cavenderia fasciculata]
MMNRRIATATSTRIEEMIDGVKYWVGQIPFFLVLLPFLWYQLYLSAKEYSSKRFDHSGNTSDNRYNPIPVKLLVFICLNCSCTLRIIFTFYIWHLDIDDPGANLNAYTIYILNVYFIILEWWFIVFFWISMLMGFISSKSVFDPTILKKVETILWIIVSIVTLFHAMLIIFNSINRHDIIDTDQWWRIGYLIIVYIGIIAFAIYSTRLLRAYKSIKFDKIIYKKVGQYYVCGIPTATLSPLYLYFGKGNHPTQDIMNLIFSLFEWGHYPLVIILLGSGPIVQRFAKLLRMPRLQRSKSSESLDTSHTRSTRTSTFLNSSTTTTTTTTNTTKTTTINNDNNTLEIDGADYPQDTIIIVEERK